MPHFLTGELGTAVVDSPDVASRHYRYHLTRHIGAGAGSVAFIMLNPSTADHHCNDPSVTRCIKFARAWGFQTLVVGNLYARYATDPADLRNENDPVGPDNDQYLHCIATQCDEVVVAWGAQGEIPFGREDFMARANTVLHLLWEAMELACDQQRICRLVDGCKRQTERGYPLHPGRLSSGTQSEEWLVENSPPQIRPPPR